MRALILTVVVSSVVFAVVAACALAVTNGP